MRMSRTYAARRLLEHGPLTLREIREITRWPHGTVKNILARLIARCVVTPRRAPGCGCFAYALTPDFQPRPETKEQ